MILLPAIDLRGGRCVRLVQGDFDKETVYDDNPIDVALAYERDGAEWLHVVDLDAALEGVPGNREIIERVIASVHVPVQCSGGIRSLEDIQWAVDAGAGRVVLGTRALTDPSFVGDAVAIHDETIAVGLDVRGDRLQARGWTEDAGELFPTLEVLDAFGCSRYVVTDVARDGMLQGPNLGLLQDVAMRTPARIVASGGVSSLEDLRAIAGLGVESCIVGKALYANKFTLPEALDATK
jgi:1-(5-phosphoribosyl)-5-[(5-phosphoribosylamino)methylideneamino] imidazole-4-carboxamide isomerase/N-(5'phosphoribosyl)anthranilate isomerase